MVEMIIVMIVPTLTYPRGGGEHFLDWCAEEDSPQCALSTEDSGIVFGQININSKAADGASSDFYHDWERTSYTTFIMVLIRVLDTILHEISAKQAFRQRDQRESDVHELKSSLFSLWIWFQHKICTHPDGSSCGLSRIIRKIHNLGNFWWSLCLQ